MRHSPFSTILSLGPEMVFLYNDAAISTLTIKHPGALGGLYRDVFHEAWDLVGADLEACFTEMKQPCWATGSSRFFSTECSKITIGAIPFIPVYENGKIAGVYDAFRNMTETVVGAQNCAKARFN
jgi:hypothetical protein